MTESADISFVHLGITIEHLRNSISIGGFKITFYGIIIGVSMLTGLYVAQRDAKRRGQNPDLYLDFAMYAIIFSIIGARLYYVIFAWETYRDDPIQILNLRGGGLAIYGGIIAAVLTLTVFCRIRKVSFYSMADSGCLGLITGQIIGRWGNFFNCEAFGGYTNNFFAMRIRKALVNNSIISKDILNHLIVDNGVEYIQVHPTFLYESMWNLLVLAFLLWYRKRKRFDGEVMLLYLTGYGIGRFWIEGLRTDQLIFFETGIPVSQALSVLLVVASTVIILWKRSKQKAIATKGE